MRNISLSLHVYIPDICPVYTNACVKIWFYTEHGVQGNSTNVRFWIWTPANCRYLTFMKRSTFQTCILTQDIFLQNFVRIHPLEILEELSISILSSAIRFCKYLSSNLIHVVYMYSVHTMWWLLLTIKSIRHTMHMLWCMYFFHGHIILLVYY